MSYFYQNIYVVTFLSDLVKEFNFT